MLVRVRNGQVDRGAPEHLRAAAVLRGVPARPDLSRAAGHHRADLRHLPGRLSDERVPGDRGRVRRLRRRADSERFAASCTAENGSRATLSTSTCCTPRTSSDTTARSSWQDVTATSRARSAAEEDRQRSPRVGRRPRDPPGQRPGRRLLPRSDQARAGAPAEPLRRAATPRWTPCAGWPGSTFRTSSRTTSSWRSATRSLPHRRWAGSSRPAGSTSRAAEFEEHVVEDQVPHSTALHARLRDRGAYLAGPLARFALNAERSHRWRATLRRGRPGAPCPNPFRSIVVRAVELLYACDEALRLIDGYEEPDAPGRGGPRRRSGTDAPKHRAGSSTTATGSTRRA